MIKNLDGAENVKIKMVDVLSTFLLLVTTVHSIDHDGMVKTFKGIRGSALLGICRNSYSAYHMWHMIYHI